MTIQREPNETPLMVALAELNSVFFVLQSDVANLIGTLFDDENGETSTARDARRRQFVRAAYAFIEGTVYAMKQVALQRVYETQQPVEPSVLLLLSEQEPHLDEQGRVSHKSARITTRTNIRFGLETYASVHGVPCLISWGDSEWGDLKAGLGVRDRLMHPKRATSLVVSDEETLQVMRAALWFAKSVKNVMAAVMPTLIAETPGGEEIMRELFPDGSLS